MCFPFLFPLAMSYSCARNEYRKTFPRVRFSVVGYLLFTLLSMLQIRMERDYSYTNVNAGFSLKEFFLSLVSAHLMCFLGSNSFISQLIFTS